MEYIVYRETEKPLLIDQPEDNVDDNISTKRMVYEFEV